MILYKYLHPDRLSVLREQKIRFTQPGDFNDPFEFRPRIESLMQDQQTREHVAANFDRLVDEELAQNGALLQSMPKETWKQLLLAQKPLLPALFSLLMPETLNRTSFSIDKVLNQSVGILCLSEMRDSLLMWGHYADNHRGLAIGLIQTIRFLIKNEMKMMSSDIFERLTTGGSAPMLFYQIQHPQSGSRASQSTGLMNKSGEL